MLHCPYCGSQLSEHAEGGFIVPSNRWKCNSCMTVYRLRDLKKAILTV